MVAPMVVTPVRRIHGVALATGVRTGAPTIGAGGASAVPNVPERKTSSRLVTRSSLCSPDIDPPIPSDRPLVRHSGAISQALQAIPSFVVPKVPRWAPSVPLRTTSSALHLRIPVNAWPPGMSMAFQ